jgi:hypothetical protein
MRYYIVGAGCGLVGESVLQIIGLYCIAYAVLMTIEGLKDK